MRENGVTGFKLPSIRLPLSRHLKTRLWMMPLFRLPKEQEALTFRSFFMVKYTRVKTNKLLNDLGIYLRGFQWHFSNYGACLVVVLDNDVRDCEVFQKELEDYATIALVMMDHVFCVAVEEMEAWLLGDEHALFSAYPNARESKYREYVQDSICGTWEVLADVVFRGGLELIWFWIIINHPAFNFLLTKCVNVLER